MVVFLDETKSRCKQINEVFDKSKNPVTCCRNSNEFMTKITAGEPQRLFMDVTSWIKGRIIYNYFEMGKRLAEVPIVFYNAPENFTGIDGRPKHGQDEILTAPTPIETVIEMVRKVV